MSVCVQSGQPEEDSGSEEVTTATAAVREVNKQKPASKVVRVLTVLAYLLSVSLAAILLSVYYVCVWKSPELPPLNDTEPAAAARASRLSAHLRHADYNPARGPHHQNDEDHTLQLINMRGGGDSAVNVVIPPTPIPIANSFENASSTDATSDPADSPTPAEQLYNSSFPSTEDYNGTTANVT